MYALTKRQPQRITLIPATETEPAVEILFAPIDRKMRRLVVRAVRRLGPAIDNSRSLDSLSDAELEAVYERGEAVSRELIRLGALEWWGIGDGAARPKPLALTPSLDVRTATVGDADRPTGTIDALLDDDVLFEAADRLYVKASTARDAEKNGSSASPGGTGGAATRANAIASSAARPKPGAGATSAPMSRTRSRPRKRKGSGTS